jgi:hypothetical protein
MFPEIIGNNLEEKEFQIPFDLEKEYNLVIIAFRQYHQMTINRWVPFVEDLQKKHPIFEYYELPILAKRNKAIRFWIDGGMRAGIRDKETRERTITIYLNKSQFRAQLNIIDEEDIHLIFMTKQGKIYWREKGDVTQTKLESLENAIEHLLK